MWSKENLHIQFQSFLNLKGQFTEYTKQGHKAVKIWTNSKHGHKHMKLIKTSTARRYSGPHLCYCLLLLYAIKNKKDVTFVMESAIKMCYKIFSTKLYCVIWEHDLPGIPVLFLEISVRLVRFDFLTVVTIMTAVWEVIHCSPVNLYWCFRQSCCIHHQGRWIIPSLG